MQEATFLILTALAAGSQHGYGVISDVLAISGGRVRLRAGTLYSALDRLRIDGLVDVGPKGGKSGMQSSSQRIRSGRSGEQQDEEHGHGSLESGLCAHLYFFGPGLKALIRSGMA